MRVRELVVAGTILIAPLLSPGCGRRRLTAETAEATISRFFGDINSQVACGGLEHKKLRVHLRVVGLHDTQQPNAAVATVDFQDLAYRVGCPDQYMYAGPGEASFVYSSNGEWVLTKAVTREGWGFDKLNVPVN